jgi:hypothetical protein
MSAGDVYAGILVFSGSDDNLIQPDVGDEVTIHNLWYNGEFEIIITDGSNEVTIQTVSGTDGITYIPIHITNSYYIKVTETGGTSGLFGYDGIKTKD